MKKLIGFLFMTMILMSCSKNINPINYGSDACEFCRMTVVDKTHAAQIVTNKGKNFKFDATECMIHYLQSEAAESDMLHILSANYLEPGVLIDVKEATFIISENIPSPMGAYLSAIGSKEKAKALQQENGGDLYTWKELKEVFSERPSYDVH